MPTNVGAEYKKAEAEYRKARAPQDRLSCLKEMLRTIPKHKGTEHLQADIKTRMKQLTEELAGPKKGGARTGPSQTVKPDGAAQIALLGPPNSGKSALLAKGTGAQTEVGPYPFTTQFPIPGMLPFEDVYFQLVDLPPISADFMEPWIVNALQTADAALLIIDLSDPGCADHIQTIESRLDQKRVSLVSSWPQRPVQEPNPTPNPESEDLDPFRLYLPTLLLVNKADLLSDPDEINTLQELLGFTYPTLPLSAETGKGIDQLAEFLFKSLGTIRVYTKAPGKPPEENRPYTFSAGSTVMDVAQRVHKDIAQKLKFAKVWEAAALKANK